MLYISMTTAPRKIDCSGASIENTRGAGFELEHTPIHLFMDYGADCRKDVGVVAIPSLTPLGAYQNWLRSLLHMCELVGDDDWLLMLQDDIDWRRDGYAQLLKAMQSYSSTAGCLSAYTSPAMVSNRSRLGNKDVWTAVNLKTRGFVGALALCFPAEVVKAMAKSERVLRHTHHRKIDVVVGNFITKDLRKKLLVHVPSLVDHKGNGVSTIGRDIRTNMWSRVGFRWRKNP